MLTAIDPDTIARALSSMGAASSDFDLNGDLAPLSRPPLKPAGVLVPLIRRASGVNVILTKRAMTIRHHPGQIAFPGGRVDPDDEDHIAAALREANEEIGLPSNLVRVLGELPSHETVTSYAMHPVVGWVTSDFNAELEKAEVSEVFEVPLHHVLDLNKYAIQSRVWHGVERYFFTVPYGPHYIWGATARVLHAFANRMRAYEN